MQNHFLSCWEDCDESSTTLSSYKEHTRVQGGRGVLTFPSDHAVVEFRPRHLELRESENRVKLNREYFTMHSLSNKRWPIS